MRARTTAELLAKELDYPIDSIQFDDDLYLCETEYFFDVISQLSSDPATLFIVAHNPGIHEAEHYLSGVERDNVPTCGICGFEMPTWTYPEMFSCKEIFYDYPKNVLH